MGRLVQPAQLERVVIRSGGVESAQGGTLVAVGGDTYQDRIAKYIPGEVIAAYITLDRMLVQDPEASKTAMNAASASGLFDPMSPLVLWPLFALLVGLIFTPLYIRQLAHSTGPQGPWRTQAVISTLAFLVWAYAIKGSAFTVGLGNFDYSGVFASVLLIVFTLASGLFTPMPVSDGRGAP